MKIKVLGSGCAKCQLLEKTAREAVRELGVEAEIEHVRDINKIMEYPVLTTPGLVIDENLVCSGRVPSKGEVAAFITAALAKQG